MPEHIAKDGKVFGNPFQLRKYNASLAEKGAAMVRDAPGGKIHIDALKAHGQVVRSEVQFEGNGRWRHIATHSDGYKSTSVHPAAAIAHQMSSRFLGVEPPPQQEKAPADSREKDQQEITTEHKSEET